MIPNKALITLISCWLLLQGIPVHAELVVITNPRTNITVITTGQLRRIFFGQTTALPNGEPIEPLDVENNRNTFYQSILGKNPDAVDNYWASVIFTGKAQPPRQVSMNDAKLQIASSPHTITYIDRSQVDASTKVINIINGQ